MEFKASHRFARISPRKAKLVMDLIRGLGVNDALEFLRLCPKRASYMIDKVIRSAVASATENADVDTDSLFVARAYAECGPTIKRYRPRARGMATTIRKRTSHLVVVLSDGQPAAEAPAGDHA